MTIVMKALGPIFLICKPYFLEIKKARVPEVTTQSSGLLQLNSNLLTLIICHTQIIPWYNSLRKDAGVLISPAQSHFFK